MGRTGEEAGRARLRAESVVVHKHGTTIGSSGDKVARSPLAVYLGARNAILFAWRNYPAFAAQAVLMQLVQAARYLPAGSPANFRHALRGIAAGLRGETGKPDPMPVAPATRAHKPA